MYVRATYADLRRYEIVAPHVRNDGTASGYPDAVRRSLTELGFGGWTEFASCGYWLGAFESGTTFVLYAPPMSRGYATRDILVRAGRACMPDQDAVQVVEYPNPVVLTEG